MSRRLFSNLSSSIAPDAVKPWWKALSPLGWLLVFSAIFSTFSFVLGAMTGETLFTIFSKRGGGNFLEASWEKAPTLFVFLMLANAIISFVLWFLFLSWVKERKNA